MRDGIQDTLCTAHVGEYMGEHRGLVYRECGRREVAHDPAFDAHYFTTEPHCGDCHLPKSEPGATGICDSWHEPKQTKATLVERLRNDWGKGYGDMSKVSLEAADALEAKDAEIERLRKVVHRAHRAQGMGPCICVDCEGRGYDD